MAYDVKLQPINYIVDLNTFGTAQMLKQTLNVIFRDGEVIRSVLC